MNIVSLPDSTCIIVVEKVGENKWDKQ
jgi:hypothetical protein